MIDNLITFSVGNKFVIGTMILALIGWGSYSLTQLPIDAVPDITNNQVLVITTSPNLATLEVERLITTPIELSIQNLPGVEEIRSISRFGLSVVTVVFREKMGTYLPRQLVAEQLKQAEDEIPKSLGVPRLAPISTGLSEIYQYVLRAKEGYQDQYSLMDLRTIQDWIVKRQFSGIPGVIEINTLGGELKEYEVAINPELLRANNVTLNEVLSALENSNENSGGAYIEKTPHIYFIRTEGMAKSLEDIGKIVVKMVGGIPILVGDVGTLQFGHAPRFGATTINGEGEVVGGIVLMLKGSNSAEVTTLVEQRVNQIQKSLPEGVEIEPFLVRNDLISRAISTVRTNLIEGGLIVIFILVLLLGNFRAGLIVASVIPLSMLFALGMMHVFGISANLMSLGAIDFGLIVDGAVIIVESIVHRLQSGFAGQKLTKAQLEEEVTKGAIRIRKSAAFGEIIILMVYIPILTLSGIEGKMFRPMALTVGFAILGALILSLTYVPMMSALFLNKKISTKITIADRIMSFFQFLYAPVIRFAMWAKWAVVFFVILFFSISIWVFSQMGGEFIPTLEEGDLALHQILPPGSSLEQSVNISLLLQRKLLEEFPEVEKVVTKIGSAEVPTDPMPIETGDIIVVLKPKREWVSASTRQEMFEKMEQAMLDIPGVNYEFSQPIQMRFNELMTGSRGDIAIKIYGEDLEVLATKGREAERLLAQIDGLTSLKLEQITGMPQIVIQYNYEKLAQYGLQVGELNKIIRAGFAGAKVSTIFEKERRFDLVVRLEGSFRKDISNVRNLYVPLPNGQQVPLIEIATVEYKEGPTQISRDNTKRRIVISANAGKKDTETLVNEMKALLASELELPPGYYISYGGQFENLYNARKRLMLAVPIALALIFIMLFFTFNSISQALLIFTAIPLSAIGGIWALWLRDMPFSISAGIGFIALFGVAVLNGIVLISYFNQLEEEGISNILQRIFEGTRVRLRPVLLTASVASFGFLPMAISSSGGAEVQRPLATVVIGGLITATLLTLIVLPIFYYWWAKWKQKKKTTISAVSILIVIAFCGSAEAQRALSLEEALDLVSKNYPALVVADLQIKQHKLLEGTGFDFSATEFYYGGDGLGRNGDLAEHSFGFRQSFQLPKAYRKNNELLQEQTELVRKSRQLTTWQLQLLVASIYSDWQVLHHKSSFFTTYDSLYSDFLNKAVVRVNSGETSPLESLTARNKSENLRLRIRQNEEMKEDLESQLRLYLNVSDDLMPPPDTFLRMPMNPIDSLVAQHPILSYNRQLEIVAQRKTEVEKNKLLPQMNIGYATQIFSGVGGLSGVQIGVRIPIYRKAQYKRIEAATTEVEIARAQGRSHSLLLERQLLQGLQTLKQSQQAIEFYEQQGKAYARELLRISSLNYSAGEIDYVEYIQAFEQAFNLQLQYLDHMKAYNRAVIQINYLNL